MKYISHILTLLILIFTPLKTYSTEEIKLAYVAPEGSTWAKVAQEWDAELRKASNNRLGLRLYSGGVAGDERDIVRKMRIGQIHAAGLTGLGLGIINPAVRVMELPMLAKNYAEVDALIEGLGPKLQKGFQEKGFEILGWSETGFVNVFSNKPVTTSSDMKGMKMWAWEGDPVVKEMYARFGIVPIPLALPDVLTSLSTDLIDGVYAPPLGAIALQWHTKTKYMSDLKLADSIGGFIITRSKMSSLPPDLQKLLRETGAKYGKILKERIRADNDRAYAAIEGMGIKVVNVPPHEVEKIQSVSELVWNDLAGSLYSPDLLATAKAILEKVRETK